MARGGKKALEGLIGLFIFVALAAVAIQFVAANIWFVVSGLAGLLVLFVVVVAVASSIADSSRRADDVALVRRALAEYDAGDDRAVASYELEVLKRSGTPPEKSLLYAIRVSHPGTRAKTLKTLIGRWGTTNAGAGGAGLQAGSGSELANEVRAFLRERFVGRAALLCDELTQRAEEQAAKRKSTQAKRNALARAREKLEGFAMEIDPPDQSLIAVIERSIERLESQENGLGEE